MKLPDVKRCGIGYAHESHEYVPAEQNQHDPDERFLCPGLAVTIAPVPHGGVRYVDPADQPPKDRGVIDRLADDEPVFVIRGGDVLAVAALAAYARHARLLGLARHAQGVEARAVQFMRWQADNHDRVREPD